MISIRHMPKPRPDEANPIIITIGTILVVCAFLFCAFTIGILVERRDGEAVKQYQQFLIEMWPGKCQGQDIKSCYIEWRKTNAR